MDKSPNAEVVVGFVEKNQKPQTTLFISDNVRDR
jgi:hypothetical protein